MARKAKTGNKANLEMSLARLAGDEQSRRNAICNIVAHALSSSCYAHFDTLRAFAIRRVSNAVDMKVLRDWLDLSSDNATLANMTKARGIKCGTYEVADTTFSDLFRRLCDAERDDRAAAKKALADALEASKPQLTAQPALGAAVRAEHLVLSVAEIAANATKRAEKAAKAAKAALSAPAAPMATLAPVVPAAPAAPVGSAAPMATLAPAEPVVPAAPVVPVGSAAPMATLAPAEPAAPMATLAPVGSATPAAPAEPAEPMATLAPVVPVGSAEPLVMVSAQSTTKRRNSKKREGTTTTYTVADAPKKRGTKRDDPQATTPRGIGTARRANLA